MQNVEGKEREKEPKNIFSDYNTTIQGTTENPYCMNDTVLKPWIIL